MGNITTNDGVAINFERSGSGPSVILVHGITEDLHAWDQVATDLGRDHDVIQIDLRGHGQSGPADIYNIEAMAADVVDLATQLGLARPHLIGHSLGGLVVSAAAGTCEAASVINVDQILRLDAFQDLVKGAEEMLRSDAFPMVMQAMFTDMAGPTTPDDVIAATAKYSAAAKQDVVLGVWEPLLTLKSDDLIELVTSITDEISAPYLAIHGTDPGDEYTTWLRSAIGTADLEIWEGGGHWPHLAEQNRFTTKVREFHTQS